MLACHTVEGGGRGVDQDWNTVAELAKEVKCRSMQVQVQVQYWRK